MPLRRIVVRRWSSIAQLLRSIAKLSEHLSDRLSKRRLVGSVEDAELADNEVLFQSGEDRLDCGGFEQAGGLPLPDQYVSDSEKRSQLRCDRHHDHVRLVCTIADNDGGPLLRVGLAGERKGTSTTSPNLKGIVHVVVRIIPDGGEGRLTHTGGGASQFSILLAHANEIDEILDFCNPICR